MDKRKFQVIEGNKANNSIKNKSFISAYATKTRLMGVLGMYIHWEINDGNDFYQFFHLDAEEYGVDNYLSMYGKDEERKKYIIASMMGGLGGELVPINEYEAKYLASTFIDKSIKANIVLPEPKWEYFDLYKEKIKLDIDKNVLMEKICEDILDENQLLNYFIMRSVAFDIEGMNYLKGNNDIDYEITRKPSILLKNIIDEHDENGDKSYLCESIIDLDGKYMMIISEFEIGKEKDRFFINNAQIKSMMSISSTEVAFSLNRAEYLSIYDIDEVEEFINEFILIKPQAMKHNYDSGYLFTEFNNTNKHVSNDIYYLNDDIFCVYYVTLSGQMIVMSYDPSKLERVKEFFKKDMIGSYLSFEEDIVFEESILYEFVYSGYTDFYEYLEAE